MELRNVSITHNYDIKVEQKNSSRRRIFARLDGPWAIDVSSFVVYRYIYLYFFSLVICMYVHCETILASKLEESLLSSAF